MERIPLPTECCHIRRDSGNGQYFYDYSVDGVSRSFTGYELSFLFFESYDGIRGRGLLDLARETIGAEGAAQQYGQKFYQNGAMISGIVELDADLNREGRELVKEQFASYNPYGDDAFKVAVLTRGYKYTPIGLKQSDAQYIESRAFSVEEISHFTGIPKHMLQSGKESYESNQQQRVVFVQDTLAPYVIQWEQENSFKCLLGFQRREGLYFKGNLSVLMRGDDLSRAQFYEKMVQALETAVPAADVLPPQDMDGAARKEAPDEDAVPGEAAIPGAQAAQEGRRAVVCSPKGLNLRAGPARSYAALEVLPDGMEVLALDLPRGAAVPGWELVDAEGRTGWASTRFLRPLEG